MMKRKLIILAAVVAFAGCKNQGVSEGSGEKQTYSCRVIDSYRYSEDVPSSEPIGDDYYSNTLFVGDSRMGAIQLYGKHKNAEVAYVTSLNIFKIDHTPVDERKEKITIPEVLNQTDKGNIYILVGINNIQMTSFDEFSKKYQGLIDSIIAKNPQANIYLMSSYCPHKVYGLEEDKLPEHVALQNAALKELAQNNRVFYLNLDDALSGAGGKVDDMYVSDGLHLNAAGTRKLEEYLSTHVVRREKYVKEVCE